MAAPHPLSLEAVSRQQVFAAPLLASRGQGHRFVRDHPEDDWQCEACSVLAWTWEERKDHQRDVLVQLLLRSGLVPAGRERVLRRLLVARPWQTRTLGELVEFVAR